MTENSHDELAKRANNLFYMLQKNPKSIFYLTGNTTSKTLFNKAAKSAFEKDRVFVNLYNQLENKKKILKNPIKILYLLPRHFAILKVMWTIQHYIALVSILSYCMLILQIDTRFLAKSAIYLKCCLLLVDLFISKVYIYPMKSRNLLAKKLKLFYEDVKNKRTGRMRLQMNLEFKQNQILKLNHDFNVDMFHTRLGGEKHSLRSKK